MDITTTELQSLLNHVEQHYDKKYQSPTDFENLSLNIFEITKFNLSISTLKRLWGYIPQRKKVRKSTLDILAIYLGYSNFNEYLLEKQKNIDSGYLNTQTILSVNLLPKTTLEIGWEPNRLCRIQYQGDNNYEFIDVKNTSLKPNTYFRTAIFSIGQPLYLEDIEDESNQEKVYIVGKKTGLTVLRILDGSE